MTFPELIFFLAHLYTITNTIRC